MSNSLPPCPHLPAPRPHMDWRVFDAHGDARHALATPVTTDRLRVVVTATNGDPSAAIYEIRCHAAD